MLCIQLHKSTFYDFDWHIFPIDTNAFSCGAAHINHEIDQGMNGILIKCPIPEKIIQFERFSEIILILSSGPHRFASFPDISVGIEGIGITILSLYNISLISVSF